MAAAIGLGLLLVLGRALKGGGDDPDPARQRPGFLDAEELPVPAPPRVPGVPAPGRRALVFFTRHPSILCRELARTTLDEKADLIVVAFGGACPEARAIIADDTGQKARAYGMPRPANGGYPVGYVVVDGHGMIRYRTLDPGVARHLPEVATMVKATE